MRALVAVDADVELSCLVGVGEEGGAGTGI